jgi:hypothetical protein
MSINNKRCDKNSPVWGGVVSVKISVISLNTIFVVDNECIMTNAVRKLIPHLIRFLMDFLG